MERGAPVVGRVSEGKEASFNTVSSSNLPPWWRQLICPLCRSLFFTLRGFSKKYAYLFYIYIYNKKCTFIKYILKSIDVYVCVYSVHRTVYVGRVSLLNLYTTPYHLGSAGRRLTTGCNYFTKLPVVFLSSSSY